MPTEPLAMRKAARTFQHSATRGGVDVASGPKLASGHSPYRLRGFQGERDLPQLVRLFNDCALQSPTGNRTDLDELRSDLARPGIDLAQNVTLLDSDERLVGFAALMTHRGAREISADLWLKSTPSAAEDADRALVDWAERRSQELSLAAQLPVELLAMVDADRAARRELLRSRGFAIGRHFARMRRPLGGAPSDESSPSGFSVRPLHASSELRPWVEALNAAFADHWRFSAKLLDQARQFRDQDPNFRSDGDLVAVAPDGSLAGFCQCVIRANENKLTGRREGWISLLGVVPAFRRIGLGRTLLMRGLQWLTTQGMTEAYLGVDAASPTGAFRLYESAGFTISHRRLAFVRRYSPCARDT